MVLSQELTAKLRELCRAEGATLFMLLLATLKVLLARYTGAGGHQRWDADCRT